MEAGFIYIRRTRRGWLV